MPPTKFQVMQVLNEIFEGAELICLGGTDIKSLLPLNSRQVLEGKLAFVF